MTIYHVRLRLAHLFLLLVLPALLAGCGAAMASTAPTPVATTPRQAANEKPAKATASPPLTATTAAATATATIEPTPLPDDLSPLSDEFESAGTLSVWQDHSAVEGWPSQIETLDINTTSPGHLYLVPYTSGWYADYRGVFLFKEITGDFVATTRIQATGKRSEIPSRIYSFTGLMARAPREVTPESWEPGHENWLFITTGFGEGRVKRPQLETKTTVDSYSELVLSPSRTGWVELRVVRVGAIFLMMYRFEGQPWQMSRVYKRPDLPETLQVGLNAYTDWESVVGTALLGDPAAFNNTVLKGPETAPDLIVRSDYVRFQRPQVPEEIRAKLPNAHVSHDEWLAAFGND